MKRDPFHDLFSKLIPGGHDPWSGLWNPLHPSALFCVWCAIAAMVLASPLGSGG